MKLGLLCATLSFAFSGHTIAQTAAAPTAAVRAPTLSQLAQFPAMTGFQISPDGKHMLAIESAGDVRNIVVWKLADLSARPTVIGAKNMQIRTASFLKNDMLQVDMMQPYELRGDDLVKTFINKLLFTDLEGKNWIEPMASVEIARSNAAKLQAALSVPSVLSRMAGDPDHVVLESDNTGDNRDVFRYNVRNGTSTRLMRLGETDGRVWVNAAGVPWAKSRFGSDGGGAFIAIDFRSPEGRWDEHFRNYVKNRDQVDVIAPGAKPNVAIIQNNMGQEFSAIYEYDIAAKKTLSKLFEHKFFDATGVRTEKDDGAPGKDGYFGFTYAGLFGIDTHWDDPVIDGVVKGVAQALGIKEINQKLMSVSGSTQAEVRSLDGVTVRLMRRVEGATPTYLFRVSGLNYPTEHYLLSNQKLQLLAKEFPAIDKAALGTSRFVYYRARDGLNIPAYLTVPNEKLCGPGPYSAVIHPHGGPWARDTMNYDGSGWVPMLVSQCRVVLQPQYRGSNEWGRTLWVAGDREWGQKMQDDKDDGAKWLVSEKLADPKRMAMFGFSYGGYAAFAAAVRPNDLYKCAIAGAGVSDIERIWARFYSNPIFRERQAPTVSGLSPLTQADNIKIPIMVYHGDRDQIVPLIQSELFVNRAKAAGKPVEYHMLKDYAHGPAWTRQIMTQQLTIISDYLKSGCGGGL
nr:prolyl oligopeptidase family serine peptidase [uncultured Rhodoferax sp.]